MTTHVLDSLDAIPSLTDTAATVGSYDGVHRGHQAMIQRLRAEAQARGLGSLLVTFHPHHRVFFAREHEPFLLTSLPEKTELLGKTGVGAVLVLPFARPLAGMLAERFLGEVLSARLGCRLLLVGHDQAIGRDQKRGLRGIRPLARRFGIEVMSVEPVVASGETVSSTGIRSLVRQGEIEVARRLLGHPYSLTGRVVRGKGRGRAIGYPTANLELDEPFKLAPAEGIYTATAEIAGGPRQGMLYVGTRPTFGDGPRMIELFLFDFDGDLYGRQLRVGLLSRVRGDLKFDSVDALVRQIRSDEARAREFFRTAGDQPASPLDEALLAV